MTYRTEAIATLDVGKKHCFACANILDARAELCPKCGVRQPHLPGAMPALAQPGPIVVTWTLIPAFIAFIEALVLFGMTETTFAAKYPG